MAPSDVTPDGGEPDGEPGPHATAADGLARGNGGARGKESAAPRPAMIARDVIIVMLAAMVVSLGVSAVSHWYLQGSPKPVAADVSKRTTEARFVADADLSDDQRSSLSGLWDFLGVRYHLREEWAAARSTHKTVAYAIARCRIDDLDTMPRRAFSALLLDLRPTGDHYWGAAIPEQGEAAAAPLKLQPEEVAVLSLSDAVARARIAAVSGADQFYPSMFIFGWLAVIVSALATMFVTLKSSAKSPGERATRFERFWFRALTVSAVLLSTLATVLTGAKQFWDPTNAYMRNETALLSLRQLHEDIALSFTAGWDCAATHQSLDDLTRWRTTLVSLQNGTLSAPVVIASQNAPAAQSGASGSGEQRKPAGAGGGAEKGTLGVGTLTTAQ